MTIKRDILGTVVNIELTEREIKEIHCAYLMNEWNNKSPITKPAEIMPREPEPKIKTDCISRLHQCSEELRKVDLHNVTQRSIIIDRYMEDMNEAHKTLSYHKISVITGISPACISDRLRVYRWKNRVA